MAEALLLAAIAGAAGFFSAVATGRLIPLLRRGAVIDRPNERSLHAAPTPRGGGIAPLAVIVVVWAGLAASGILPVAGLIVLLGAILLAIVSWHDDRHSLALLLRLAAQIAAVALGLMALVPGGRVFQGWLPAGLDAAAAALFWVWFVNLFNFMDGIDGLAGSEAAAIGLGLMLFATIGSGQDPGVALLAAALTGSAVGFLVWNWAPARVFLGDAGSVPLGYLIGFLLLELAAKGAWKIALILPGYFLADATITLLRRLARGERVWQPHRQHFYQHAVLRGLGHAAVVRRVIAANLALVGCGWAAENGWGLAALAAAAAIVVALLASLAGRPGRAA